MNRQMKILFFLPRAGKNDYFQFNSTNQFTEILALDDLLFIPLFNSDQPQSVIVSNPVLVFYLHRLASLGVEGGREKRLVNHANATHPSFSREESGTRPGEG